MPFLLLPYVLDLHRLPTPLPTHYPDWMDVGITSNLSPVPPVGVWSLGSSFTPSEGRPFSLSPTGIALFQVFLISLLDHFRSLLT